jgi:threonine/homoserine/homoserine lactone efflux protein
MGQAIGSVIPLAVAVAIFPVPIIALLLVIGSDGGSAKGLAFVLAWSAGLAVVGVSFLLLAGVADASASGEPATWVAVLLLSLGLLLLWSAVKQWRGRPRPGDEPPLPIWMRALSEFSAAKAAGTGFALTALNPKNVMLTAAAAAEIADVGLPRSQEVVVLAAFVVLASTGVLTPLVLSVALEDRSRRLLDGVRGWLARNNAVIMAVLFLVIGAKLIGDAISAFSA